LIGLIKPTQGYISLLDRKKNKNNNLVKQKIGYLQGDYSTYSGLKVKDVIKFTKNIRNTKKDKAFELCERFSLDTSRKIGELSKGNKQKLGIVQAFMSEPELLLLDEPTSGLDPLLQKEFQDLLSETRNLGSTIIISSHILSEIENTCDRVTIIREGKIIATEKVSELKTKRISNVEIIFDSDISIDDLNQFSEIKNIHLQKNRLSCDLSGSGNNFIKFIATKNIKEIKIEPAKIEDLFLSFYSKD